jgi:hypothetical protein
MGADDHQFFDSVSPEDDAAPAPPEPPLHFQCTPPPEILAEICRGLENRHKRLMVAAWALSPPGAAAPIQTYRRIWRYYETRPGLIDRPGKLTVASILAEVADIVR